MILTSLSKVKKFLTLNFDLNKEIFLALFKGTENLDGLPQEKFIYTMYNGKCKEFQLRQNLKPRHYLTFYAAEEVDLFLVFPGLSNVNLLNP